MYQRTLLSIKVLRPFASASHGITRPPISFLTKPHTLHIVVRQLSQTPITSRLSSNKAKWITTTTGNVIPSTGNPRLVAKLQGGFRIIREDMTCAEFHDSVWGFVIYRCVKGNDAAWTSILEKLQSHVRETLEDEKCQDLLPFHDLHVIDDKSLYGSSVEEVRAHFQAWVPQNLDARLRPDTACTIPDVSYLSVDTTPRYNYCLLVDEICLESLDHPEGLGPVVKLVCRDWESPPRSPEEKLQGVQAPFHDGITEYDEEDVGWMYMPLLFYMDRYENFHDWGWSDMYVRPPFIDGGEDETNMVGHWRRKKVVGQEKAVSET
ncbi:hypothetical protein V499_02321 [Pseudogymnoascus sp. VKM F-103]|nr:hypothetical protein V499_02321 [Pseudogymnoascus sp. VKM F-103]